MAADRTKMVADRSSWSARFSDDDDVWMDSNMQLSAWPRKPLQTLRQASRQARRRIFGRQILNRSSSFNQHMTWTRNESLSVHNVG